MKYTWLLLFTFPLLALQCEEETPLAPIDQLPPETRTGEYTFGCLVNGEAFVPESTRDITAIYQGGLLQMGFDAQLRSGKEGIAINLKEQIILENSYILDTIWSKGIQYIGSTCIYEYEDLVEGTVTITRFDDVNFIISGTFAFTTATKDCDTIRVTDGRFDIPYIP